MSMETDGRDEGTLRGKSLDGMKPEVREAFERTYKKHQEALRRLAKL